MTNYQFHPLANMFPLLEGGEFAALVEDIRAHDLHEPIVLFEDKILDGRNRYRACREGGVDPQFREVTFADHAEATAFVISSNIHRRHLTPEQKRELIDRLLKVDPTKSDRRIADTVKADHKTIASRRRQVEERGEIPHVEKRKDRKGRSQPARRKKPAPKSDKSPAARSPLSNVTTPAEPAVRPSSYDSAVSAEHRKAYFEEKQTTDIAAPIENESAEPVIGEPEAEPMVKQAGADRLAEPETSPALEPGCASNFIGGLIKLTAATQTEHPIDFFKGLLAERGDLNLSRIINFLVTVAGLPEVKQMRGRIGTLEAENSELRARIARLEAARAEAASKAVH